MSDDPMVVKTCQGFIRGKVCIGCKGIKYYSFQRIPYAQIPVGKLRFKAPRPATPWNGILDATQEPPQCYQRHMIRLDEIGGEEDCLYLNVYTPEISIDYGPYPVMVWIHGGAFVSGSSKTELCGPDIIMVKNVVLVTFNYRIGMLGFLSFEDSRTKVPGNAGLKDQVLVLKWIQNNILKFRGSKINVTLFGHGSGAACVHLHMLSPMSQGLFHKVILQSGCALNSWVNGVIGTGRIMAEQLAIDGNDKEVLKKLQSVPVESLYHAQELLTNDNRIDTKWFCSPVIEKQTYPPPFLPDEPINIIRSKQYAKVPMIIGYTSREGMFWDLSNRLITGLPKVITDFKKVIPSNLNVRKEHLLYNTIAKKIENFYYGPRIQQVRMGRNPRLKKMDPLYQLLTDVFFLRGIHSSVKNHVEMSPDVPVYYYKFTFESDLNVFKKMFPAAHRRKYPGAIHGDDLNYIFRTFLSPQINYGSIEDVAINKMVKLWTTFATSGDPNTALRPTMGLTWPPTNKNNYAFLNIDQEFKVGFRPDFDRMRFWDIIYKNDQRTQYL